jgi:hypothetical protein
LRVGVRRRGYDIIFAFEYKPDTSKDRLENRADAASMGMM